MAAMPKNPDKNLIVALDIGTSKIAALVGEVAQDNQIEVIGFGTHPSRGLKRGVVVNIESTVQSIQRAIEEAELMAGCDIHSAYTGIAGSHIRSLNSHGIVAIRDREVNQSDVDRVIDAAKAVAIPADQKILHILPQEFIIDNQEGVREPVGMSGVRLEAKVHIVTGAVSAAQNINKCVRRCGLQVGDIVLEQLASSHAVLTDDEKELGVCMVDIGGGTTDIAIFTEGAIRHTHVIPIAGDHVTNDVAVALRTPTQYAEQIKIKYASVLPEEVNPEEAIQVPSVAKRPPKQVQKRALAQVVAARYEELFELVLAELRRSGFEDLIAAGIVLTGGASHIAGCIELAERIFQMPVRLGLPQYVNGLADVRDNPIYATAVGLLIHGHQSQLNNRPVFDLQHGMSLWQRMKSWFQGNF
ncbi:cell division protein FtsA [Coxiella burnetii]|uniref:Cell division protein FtsA n=3 Tax=Coxiella burnetii TaxID=777 RepID=Q83F13_COXBU|nr:cell division protein FtsA [Coxiella burnetii]NP_819190.2 cell division protein [Coxiella burnetii RSA 493]AAO89704.2 cell division protein [Coxiella burnetii RSA 493]ABS77777.2 cell division protein [Coxiella burnetii Dugway 5J108-111]ACJ21024.1 cell division protein [Coxiella burnetii CbuK_Q154]ARI65056.1 cell division protein FtsA [Coxiella burnetii]AZV74506.1 cell division protein FtsA [Coxiella burnetii]